MNEIDCTHKVPAVRWDEHDDQVIVDCAHCKIPILTFWAPNNGGLVRGEYVIVADWMYHPKCWVKTYERWPMG